MEIADRSLENFIQEVDSIIVIPNQNLFNVANENTTLSEAFKMADNVLYSGVRSITDLMMMPGLINLDFADVKNIMEDKGKAIMGTGEAEGKGRAREAAHQALSNPLLDDCSLQGAKGVLINITGSQDITLPELDEAANIIKEEVGDDANIIFGSSYDDNLSGKIRVSIVVTGINDGMPRVVEKKPVIEEPSLIDQSYDDNTYVPTVEEPVVDFAPVSTDTISFTTQDEIENPTISFSDLDDDDDVTELTPQDSVEQIALDNDFASLDKSDEMPEMPQASALFNAIMNGDNKEEENEKADLELNSVAPSDDFFSSRMTIEDLPQSEEPILFANNDTSMFKDTPAAAPEPEETPVMEEEESRPNFIERVIGISRARRKSHEEPEVKNTSRLFEEQQKTGTDDGFDLSGEDWDIPSFLRRK